MKTNTEKQSVKVKKFGNISFSLHQDLGGFYFRIAASEIESETDVA
jgi:hypothetical protein